VAGRVRGGEDGERPVSDGRGVGRTAGLWGEALDRLLGAGQFVVVEPDMSEFVCSDREQMLRKLEECGRRGVEVAVRWKRADGSVARHAGPLPAGWGLEAAP
jgi:hypothetical protein